MRTFIACSVVSVLCTVLICIYVVPPLLVQGYVDVGGPGFELLVVFPTLIAIPVSLVAGVTGAPVLWAAKRRPNAALVCAAVGQLVTWLGIAVILVGAFAYPSTGWELVTVPFALIVGQSVVAVGLGLLRRRYRLGAP